MEPERNPRAMVIDDDDTVRKLLVRFLAARRWDAVAAQDAREALETFEAGRFRLIFCDVDLGLGMDGIELAQRLAALEPEVRIAMMSGSPHQDRVAKAGLGKLLGKPFQLSQIDRLLAVAAPSA